MKRINQFLRATIVLCGVTAGVLASFAGRAEAQEKKCYYCECQITCVCVEVPCKPVIET